jgi:hypothetical protein
VIKEVEKIVEVPVDRIVEVIKEVEKIVEVPVQIEEQKENSVDSSEENVRVLSYKK